MIFARRKAGRQFFGSQGRIKEKVVAVPSCIHGAGRNRRRERIQKDNNCENIQSSQEERDAFRSGVLYLQCPLRRLEYVGAVDQDR